MSADSPVQRGPAAPPLQERCKLLEKEIQKRDAEIAALREERAQAESVFKISQEMAGLGHWQYDIPRDRFALSENVARIFGLDWPCPEMTFEELTSRSHPDDRARAISNSERAIESGDPFEEEFRIVRPDGTVRIIHVRTTTIFDDAGAPQKIIGSTQDITERRRSEQALAESEDKYRQLFDNAQVALFRSRIEDGLLLECNERALRILGVRRREEVIGRLVLRDLYVDPDARDRALELLRTRGEIAGFETEIRRPDGVTTWVRFTAKVFPEDGWIEGVFEDITARKRAEEALRKNEFLHRAITDSTSEGFLLFDDQFRIVEANPALCAMLRKTSGDVVGRSAWEIVADDGRESVRRLIECLPSTGHGHAEIMLGSDPNAPTPVLMHATYLSGAEDEIEAGFSFFVDISARKKAEEEIRRARDELERRVLERTRELQESTRLLESTLHSLRDAVFVVEADGARIRDSNPAAERIFGYAQEELIGFPTERLHENAASREQFRAYLRPAVEREGFLHLAEFRMRRKNGEAFPTEHIVTPLRNDDGTIQGWVSVVRDITERKRWENQLRASEERFRLLAENSYDIIAEADQDGRFLYVNPRVLEIAGHRPEDLLGRSCFDNLHPDELPYRKRTFEAQMEHPQKRHQEHRVRHRDGHWLWLESALSTYVTPSGETRVIMSSRDITERKELEAEVLRISEYEKLSVGQEIHDGLCQELTGILCLCKVAEGEAAGGGDASPLLGEVTDLVREAQQHAHALSKGLTPFSFDDAEGLIESLRELVERVDRQSEPNCAFLCPARIAVADGSRALHLYRIAQEAMHNALRHGGARNLCVSLFQTGNRLLLAVEDDGRGIDDPPPQKGMGMNIMRYRAGLLGGALRIAPRLGGGTIVECEAPLTSPTDKEIRP